MRYRALVVALLFFPGFALGQVPDGGTVQVNSLPWPTSVFNGGQVGAFDRRGNALFVWQSNGPDGDGVGVVGRRFDRFGDPLGPEFVINSYTTGTQNLPNVATDDSGGFVVTWASGIGLFGQRFESSGSPVAAEFLIGTSDHHQPRTALAVAPSGAFVVAWGAPDGHDRGIRARRYDGNGASLGAEFQVNTVTFGPQRSPALAIDNNDGSFVVVYESSGAILGQAFSPSGDRVGVEFVAAFGSMPVIASDGNGGFVVVWTKDDFWAPPGGGIVGRRLARFGKPLGAEFRVNEITTVKQSAPSLAMAENGEFVVSYSSGTFWSPFDFRGYVVARRLEASGVPREGEFVVSPTWQIGNTYRSHVASDPHGNFVVSWGHGGNVDARWYGGLLPETVDVDGFPTASSDGNGILEPGETVSISPSWTNGNPAPQSFTGIVRSLMGPSGPTSAPALQLKDAAATYDTVAYARTTSCADTADCYAATVSGDSPRPAPHWDAILREDIFPDVIGQSRDWHLHVGASFGDVPPTDPFYRFVETVLHAGVTTGCSTAAFCPSSAVTREQIAVFALLAREGAAYRPAACGTPMFDDVPDSSPFCRYVEELARRGVVSGCGPSRYCPRQPVTRAQMAAIVAGSLGSRSAPAPCTAGSERFSDVPAASPFCPWVEDLARRGLVAGCGGTNYCPSAPVTRAQMAVFLTLTFGLSLYGG